ncbi:threonine aspartase 1-like protein [Chlamydoabsidia padenii]|nr:threonine aspartase 1-like protein [Chlamydoabsidia padenii]
MPTDSPCFIAVHVGAGRLSGKKENKYRTACARACEKAMVLLKEGSSAVDAAALAISILEDDPITNAGYGSNLTLEGTVECDGCLMDGQTTQVGAVGAVPGVKNPIDVCRRMIQENNQGLLSLGRIPPIFLCGLGAKEWARKHGATIVPENDMIEENALNTFVTHRMMLHETDKVDLGHDTVGAICVDWQGNLASGVSSGGISLKSPGRVGEAALYGSGCWAQNQSNSTAGVACSVSGTGEQIMRSRLTMKYMDRLQQQDQDIQHVLAHTLKMDFLESPFLTMYEDKSVGLIALRQTERIEFWYGHVTESMGIGYMSSNANKPKTFISRKPENESLLTSGFLIC